MSLKEILGMGANRKIRYAIVALGDIAQEAMLPGVEHTGNSQVVAFVTDDEVKARKVGEQYGVSQAYRYDQYEHLLGSGTIDAVVATSRSGNLFLRTRPDIIVENNLEKMG